MRWPISWFCCSWLYAFWLKRACFEPASAAKSQLETRHEYSMAGTLWTLTFSNLFDKDPVDSYQFPVLSWSVRRLPQRRRANRCFRRVGAEPGCRSGVISLSRSNFQLFAGFARFDFNFSIVPVRRKTRRLVGHRIPVTQF